MQYSELVAHNFAKPEPRRFCSPDEEDAYYLAMQGTELRLPGSARIGAAIAWLSRAVFQRPWIALRGL